MILDSMELNGLSGHEAGRKLLQTLWQTHVSGEMPEIAVTDRGKPYFPDSPWHFSISHSKGHDEFFRIGNRNFDPFDFFLVCNFPCIFMEDHMRFAKFIPQYLHIFRHKGAESGSKHFRHCLFHSKSAGKHRYPSICLPALFFRINTQ